MMNHAGFDDNFRKKFWCEAILTATRLDNIMVRKGRQASILQIFQGTSQV